MNDADRLRSYLGEPILPGQEDSDTLFSDEEIADVLTFKGTGPNDQRNLYLAAVEGWDRKAARYANLVSTQEGGSTRASSDLYNHAKEQSDRYLQMALGRDTAHSNRIVRPGTTIR